MNKNGMRLVAMIEQKNNKENEEYEVINFLPDIKIEHIQGKEFEVKKEDHIQIPYAQGIHDLTVIVGENGVGKTRLVNDIFGLDERKMFVFKNLDKVDPIYKGKHTYYNFHALNEGSYGNNEWGLHFKGVEFKDEDIVEKEDYKKCFLRNISIIKFSSAIELSSSWWREEGIDLSTTSFLEENNYQKLLLFDMDKQIKFLLSDELSVDKIEEILKFSGKQLSVVFNDDFVEEALSRFTGLKEDEFYLEELSSKMKEQKIVEEKIKFFLTDYFAQIYAEIKFDNWFNDKLDYVGILNKLKEMVIEEEVRDFLDEYIENAQVAKVDANDFIFKSLGDLEKEDMYPKNNDFSQRLKSSMDEVTIRTINIAAYKCKFYNFSPEQRLEELKKAISQESREVIHQIDKLFNYSSKYDDAVLNIQSSGIFKPLQIIFDKTEEGSCYLIKGIERINHLLGLQRKIIDNINYLAINVNDIWSNPYILIRELINAFMFQWQGLSSGQLALLNLFGRLNSVSSKSYGSVLLLLDEVDLGLHPEWQRKWMSTALPIIGEIFQGKHVQIIMTTHSPIMLSDIYQENVIFLGTDDNGERIVKENEELSATFGQNIHDLYRQSFFLESTRGQYATETVNTVISVLYQLQHWQNKEERKNEIYKQWVLNDFKTNILSAIVEKELQEYAEAWFNVRDDKLNEWHTKLDVADINNSKENYEELYRKLYQKEPKDKGNYTKQFNDTYKHNKDILANMVEGGYKFFEPNVGCLNDKYRKKFEENFSECRENIQKLTAREALTNQEFKSIISKIINSIGERLLKNKLLSIFDLTDFQIGSISQQLSEKIEKLDDEGKKKLLEYLSKESGAKNDLS